MGVGCFFSLCLGLFFLRYNLYTSDGFQKKLHTAGAFAFLLYNTFINTRRFFSSTENIEYHIDRSMNSLTMSLNIKRTRNELHINPIRRIDHI